MMPVIEKKKFRPVFIIYILIVLICILGIGISIYMQYFKDEKIGVIFGISNEEQDEEINMLKDNFLNTFTNKLNIIQNYNGNINKIKDDNDIVMKVFEANEQTENYHLNVTIPFINVNSEVAKSINTDIKNLFKDKYDNIIASSKTDEIIYNVKYEAYIYNEIISLAILSELKEGNNNQRIIIQTYNYDLSKNQKVSIDDLIQLKKIDVNNANNKIREEIKLSQEQNEKLLQLGWNVKIRDYNDDRYKINNATEFFIGTNGYLYIIYAYGNDEYTSEVSAHIFR